MKIQIGALMSKTFICGNCKHSYETENIDKIPTGEIGNGIIPAGAHLCFNCKNKVKLKHRKRRKKDRIINE